MNRALGFVIHQDFLKIGLVIPRDGSAAHFHHAHVAVLAVNRREPLERVETNNFARVIERLMNSTQVDQRREIAAPRHAKFHDNAVDVDDLFIERLEGHRP